MEKYQELVERAQKEIDSADHLLFVTFNIAKDSKFIFSVTQQLINAIKMALEGLLEYERKSKHIEPYPKNFLFMVDTFHNKVAERREFDPTTTNFLKKMIDMEKSISSSSVHFRRDEKYVLADDEFKTDTIELNTIKSFFSSAQTFVGKVGDIIGEDS